MSHARRVQCVLVLLAVLAWAREPLAQSVAIKLATGGRTLSGTVSDATGGPVAGARIDAARLNTVADPSDAVSTTLSGTDGKFSIANLPADYPTAIE